MQIILTEEEYNALKNSACVGETARVMNEKILEAALELAEKCFIVGANQNIYTVSSPREACRAHFENFKAKAGL